MNTITQNDYPSLVADILKIAKTKGCSQADASASISTGLTVSVRKQEVDTIEFDRAKGVGITVYFGKKKGSASTSDLSKQSIEETVDKACSLAHLMANDVYCGLADAELMAYDYKKYDFDLFHPWDIQAEDAKKIALECEQYGLDFSSKITNSDGCNVQTSMGMSVYANSHGFVGEHKGSKHSISCVLISGNQDKMQRDHHYTTARQAEKLEDIKVVGQVAAEKTIAKLNPRSLKTQKANILFSPEMARGLISNFISAISGSSLYKEASFLLDHLNKKVFSDLVMITDDPFIAQGFGSSAFDSEGVKTLKRELITNGVLNGYILGSYSARRLGMQTTGNSGGTHNILVHSAKGPNLSQQAIIKSMNKGLLVTELMGQGINMVTGDYSRGASGFWIENGEIQYPVEGITIASNLKDMFLNVSALGNDLDKRSRIYTGSILIDNMMIAGE